MRNNTFYFSHDYNASQDPKVKKLIRKHAMAGYGIFWAVIEDLYNNGNSLPTDYDSIAYYLHTDIELVQSVIENFELFVIHDGIFHSQSISRRLALRDAKSKKAAKSAYERWGKNANESKTDANAMR